MLFSQTRLAWLKSGLFWRTFFLLGFLLTVSLAAWVVSFRVVEQGPRAQQTAAQIISIVTITRTALTHSAPDLRRELLFDLASNEGIRVYPLESSDKIEKLPDTEDMPGLQSTVKARLGDDTKFASKVNDIEGFWISFKIDDDVYWLMLERKRIERVPGIQWLGWAAVALVLSLLGAVFISRLINLPLARLTANARAIAKGVQPSPLPETGSLEIREANQSFNQMVDDLNRVESDRTVILAGISHDLRTPLARMQLEIEMAQLSDASREGMQSDLAQMDAIIGQFLDYARPTNKADFSPVDISALLIEAAHEAERFPQIKIVSHIEADIHVAGNRTDLKRVINNLVENARRYGCDAETGETEIEIHCRTEQGQVLIEIADHGAGIPEDELDRVLRPFTRIDTARGQANGAGLGLAIVERIAKRHGGQFKLNNRPGHGLICTITLPAYQFKRSEK